ncbi:hypothetical protein [Falsiroseomonas sp. E2-1-a20]|uniref:hypothetical protein n=1 Tax=Falsiroseomonas sp. E2-1-a20 TaxID=3239300 RepID=UPI003F38990B
MISFGTAGARAAPRPAEASRTGTLAVLLLLLPLYLQSFHYVTDIYPLYVLSKAWPLLTLPIALLGLLQRPRYAGLLVAVLAYTVLVAPLFGMIYFDQGYPSAITATLKVLPFTYYFSILWLLGWLRPRPEDLARAFTLLGGASFLLLAVLWVVMPETAYRTNAPGEAASLLFLWDVERGNRIVLPLIFGILFLFLQARLAMRRGEMLRLVVVVLGVLLLLVAYKQRTVILCLIAVLGWILFSEARLALRVVLGYGAAVAGTVLAGVLAMREGGLSLDFLGGSLSVRELTLELAVGFLNQNPLGWLLGLGALTRASDISFQEFFNHANFYLADLGWFGIVFEYGLLGAVLILAVYLAALREGLRTPSAPRDALVPALTDGLRYMLLASPVLSAIWAPGEVCALLAIFVYLQRQARTAPA